MTKEQITKLINSGLITNVVNPELLLDKSEYDLINEGYVTQIGLLDGIDDVPVVEPTTEPTGDKDDAPVVDPTTEPTVEPIVEPTDEEPIVEE